MYAIDIRKRSLKQIHKTAILILITFGATSIAMKYKWSAMIVNTR